MIHLSVAIARFIETLLWALLRAALSLAGIAVIVIGLGVLAYLALRRARRGRSNRP